MRRRRFLWLGGAVVGTAGLAWWQRNAVVLLLHPKRAADGLAADCRLAIA